MCMNSVHVHLLFCFGQESLNEGIQSCDLGGWFCQNFREFSSLVLLASDHQSFGTASRGWKFFVRPVICINHPFNYFKVRNFSCIFNSTLIVASIFAWNACVIDSPLMNPISWVYIDWNVLWYTQILS